MAHGHGGKRANSKPPPSAKGRVWKSTLTKIAAQEATRALITEHLRPILESQIQHAQGIKYLVGRAKAGGKWERVTTDKLEAMLAGQDDGSIVLEVWDKDPSVQAFSELLDRALDATPKAVALTGAGGGPLLMKWQD